MSKLNIPPSQIPIARATAIVVSLLLGALGQWLLLDESRPVYSGLLLYVAAMGLFVLAVSQLQPAEPGFSPSGVAVTTTPRFGFWVTTALLMGFVWILVPQTPDSSGRGWTTLAIWVAGMLLCVFTLLREYEPRLPSLPSIRGSIWDHRLDLLACLGLGLIAFLLRFINLDTLPYPFLNDEGEVGKAALSMLSGQHWYLFNDAWGAELGLAFVPQAITVGLLGNTVIAVRLTSAIAGTLAVIFVYLAGREMFDRKVGLYAGLVLAVLPNHLHFSRLGVENILDSLTSAAAMFLLFRGIKRNSPLDYLSAGAIAGLTFYGYPGSRLTIGLILGVIAYTALRERAFLRAHSRQLGLMLVGLIVFALPALSYFHQYPNEFFARFSDEGIFSPGRLQLGDANSLLNAPAYLLDQFSRSSLVYIARPAAGGSFNSPRPYLVPFAAVVFMLGLGYCASRLREIRFAAIFAWFWAAVILGSTLTGSPPSSQRMLMSAPALALITALGLSKLEQVISAVRPGLKYAAMSLSLLMLAVIAYGSIAFYFVDYSRGRYMDEKTGAVTYEAALQIAALEPGYRVYLVGAPDIFAVFGDFGYLAPNAEITDFNEVTRANVAGLPRDRGAYFLTFPARGEDLRMIAQWIPGGQWIDVPDRFQPSLLYVAYKVTPAQMKEILP